MVVTTAEGGHGRGGRNLQHHALMQYCSPAWVACRLQTVVDNRQTRKWGGTTGSVGGTAVHRSWIVRASSEAPATAHNQELLQSVPLIQPVHGQIWRQRIAHLCTNPKIEKICLARTTNGGLKHYTKQHKSRMTILFPRSRTHLFYQTKDSAAHND